MSEIGALFEPVWARIAAHSGSFFKTDAGRWFTYAVEDGFVLPSHTDLRIPRSDFELAFPLLPVPAAKLNKFVSGPAYVWAILHDARISNGEW